MPIRVKMYYNQKRVLRDEPSTTSEIILEAQRLIKIGKHIPCLRVKMLVKARVIFTG